jgi:hypothetical protein
LDFFEEDEPPDSPDEPRRRSSRGRRSGSEEAGDEAGQPSRQQILTRQLTLAGVSIVVLILIFLAFRGCLDARKDRGFKNYVSDLTALTAETAQLSDNFFAALNGESEDGLDLQREVNSDRGQAEGQLDRAEGLDAPDEVAGAQTQIEIAYQYRADGLDVIAEQLSIAEGDQGSNAAINKITRQMTVFLASDVLYETARTEIEQALSDEGITIEGDTGVPKSKFLPTGDGDPNYLDSNEIAVLVGNAGSSSGAGGVGADCDPGDDLSHGLGLVSTTAQPSGVVLEPGVTTTLSPDSLEFAISVQNQGGADETNIKVSLGGDFGGSQTISSIAAGATQDVTIVPNSAPSSGASASLEVTMDTVCGEGVADNNTATYDLTFG